MTDRIVTIPNLLSVIRLLLVPVFLWLVLGPEQDELVRVLCQGARRAGWTPEQLVVAVKDACSSSADISQRTTTSERETFLARIVTACIKEYYR